MAIFGCHTLNKEFDGQSNVLVVEEGGVVPANDMKRELLSREECMNPVTDASSKVRPVSLRTDDDY